MKTTSRQNQNTQSRIKILQKELKKNKLDAVFIEQPIDLFYFTGLKLSAGKLLVHSKNVLLLVDGRYLQSALENFCYSCESDNFENWLAFCKKNKIVKIGFDGQHISYDHYMRLTQKQSQEKTKIKFVPATPFFKTLRSIKSAPEIAAMKKSATLLWEGFKFIRRSLKKGVIEKELSRRFEIFCLSKGAESLSFEPIIAFGVNGAMPHYRSQNVALKEGDPVLIDIGIVVDGYHSDMTRVVFFKKEDPYIRSLYEIAELAQKSALKLCRPGTTLKALDQAARTVMRKHKVEPLFLHGLGHGIGLEGHEFPRVSSEGDDKDVKLKPGMVITIEPGLYVPGKGGVRYEDTIVITADGYENFYPQ